jgi:hypothetical protein
VAHHHRARPDQCRGAARAALVPVPATPANLQQTTVTFTDGAIFGLANVPATLATGTFEVMRVILPDGKWLGGKWQRGDWLVHPGDDEHLPCRAGSQVGDRFVLDPCQIDAIDRRLIVTNTAVSSPTISSPPAASRRIQPEP